MSDEKKIPINRMKNTYGYDDFQLEIDAAREVVENDAGFKVILYNIDREKTQVDIYSETDSDAIVFHNPIELTCLLRLDPAENKSYDQQKGGLRYQEYGKLNLFVFESELKEKRADIMYGDIIGYADYEDNLKLFEVTNDGKINSDNQHTVFGFRKYYRTIECVTLDPDKYNIEKFN